MQGKVALGLLNTDGSRQPARWAYDASTLEWNMSVDESEKTESSSGSRGLAATLKTKKSLEVQLTLNQLNDDNAALAVNGTVVPVTTGTVTDEDIGDVTAGDMVALAVRQGIPRWC
ncbi:phage tail tube protein [Rhodanobacter lindaniclasticus]